MFKSSTTGAAVVCAFVFAAGASADFGVPAPNGAWLFDALEEANAVDRGPKPVILKNGVVGGVQVTETSQDGGAFGSATSPQGGLFLGEGASDLGGGFEGLGEGSPKHGEVLIPVPLPGPGLLAGLGLVGVIGTGRRR